MTGIAVALVFASFPLSLILVRPAVRRTGLGIWHPAVAWLVLELVFFGVGAAILAAVVQRAGPAIYVSWAVLAFSLGVAASDHVARRRATPTRWRLDPSPPIRLWVVAILAAVGIAALLPTLFDVGIPFLTNDITAARSEVGGLDLQLLRVALPAGALVAILAVGRDGTRRSRLLALAAVAAVALTELALASRYLAAELGAGIVLGLAIARRPLPVRPLAAVAAVAAVLFVAVGVLRAYDQASGLELEFAAGRTINRILLIEPRTLDALQTVIPAEQPHFDGLTWVRRLGPVFGRDDIPNLGYWIYPRLFPDQLTPGYAAPGLIGEAWANFGWLGLVLFVAFGVFVERAATLIAGRRTGAADVVAGALLTLFVARTHALGLNGLAVLVVLIVAWRLLAAPADGLTRDLRAAAAWRL